MFTHELNYLAVFVTGLVPMITGFLWYGPLFGKEWQSIVGISDDAAKKGAAKAFSISIILSMILSYGMARVLTALGIVEVGDAMIASLLCWAAFSFSMTGMNLVYEQRPTKLLVIYAFYALITFEAMAIVLTLWK